MELIRLIRDKESLRGTCYFEFLPGNYKKKCWNAESVFVDESIFMLIESPFIKHEPLYDHYSFTQIHRNTWEMIIADLESYSLRIAGALSIEDLHQEVAFAFSTTRRKFEKDFSRNAAALIQLISELVEWLREQLKSHATITVLGL